MLTNLITNASDAMSTSPERRLLVRLRGATDWHSGRDGVRVTIADTDLVQPGSKEANLSAVLIMKM